ncbi:MAG: hypothetical protein AB7I48_18540 [Planctomycetaceae bacterium]
MTRVPNVATALVISLVGVTTQGAEWNAESFATAFDRNYERITSVEASGSCTMEFNLEFVHAIRAASTSKRHVTYSFGEEDHSRSLSRDEGSFSLLVAADGTVLHKVPAAKQRNDAFFFPRTQLLKQGLITVYNSNQQRAVISAPRDEGVDLPIDPRNALATRIGSTIPQLLRSGHLEFLDAWRKSDDVIVAVFQGAGGQLSEYHFSESTGLLPTTLIRRPDTGSTGAVQRWFCDYQPVLGGAAWFPSAWGYETFPTADEPTGSWVQRFRSEIRQILINQKIAANRFEIAFAPGTLIIDETTGDKRRVITAPTPALDQHLWLFLLNLCVLVMAGAYFTWHRAIVRRQKR